MADDAGLELWNSAAGRWRNELHLLQVPVLGAVGNKDVWLLADYLELHQMARHDRDRNMHEHWNSMPACRPARSGVQLHLNVSVIACEGAGYIDLPGFGLPARH